MKSEVINEEIMRERVLEFLKEDIKRINQAELLEMEGIWVNARREGKKHLNFWSSCNQYWFS